MSDTPANLHELALQSKLFKGRNEWYFCFLKLEKIAQVCTLLTEKAPLPGTPHTNQLTAAAVILPREVLYCAAGEVSLERVLADIFTLIFEIRLSATRGHITAENAAVLVQECSLVAERLSRRADASTLLSLSDFAVDVFEDEPQKALSLRDVPSMYQKDSTYKTKGAVKEIASKRSGQISPKDITGRASQIIEFISKNGPVSIKDITEIVVGCSEKTIQRELAVLIQTGVLQRTGERRWSRYLLAK